MKILQEEKLENTGSRKTQLKQQCCPSPPKEEKDPVKKILNRKLEDVLSINTKSVSVYLLMGR